MSELPARPASPGGHPAHAPGHCPRGGGGRQPSVRALALVALLGLLSSPRPAAARTIDVTSTADENSASPANGTCTLREAIIAANTNAGLGGCPAGEALPVVDRIVLPAGTYLLTIAGSDEDASETGDLDVLEPVEILGAGAELTVVDGGGDAGLGDRVFQVGVDGLAPTLLVESLTIRGGAAGSDVGGGILAWLSTGVDLRGVIIEANVAAAGGAIFDYGALSLVDTVVQDNVANGDGGGGGIAALSGLSMSRSLVEQNGSAGPGGGIRLGDPLTGSSSDLVESTIRDNVGRSTGGGVLLVNGQARIENSTLSGNRLLDADGDTLSGGSELSTWGSCYGSGCGGLGEVEVVHTTIVGHGEGEAIFSLGNRWTPNGSTKGITTLIGSIVRGSCRAPFPDGFASEGGNLEGPGDTCDFDQPTDQPSVPDLGLTPLGEWGGPTPTIALFPGSPAIDAADGSTCPETDQRGEPRFSATCDSGAFELQPGETFAEIFTDGFESGGVSAWSLLSP